MNRYHIKYTLGDTQNSYILEAETAEAAEKEFIKKSKAFYGKNLLLTDYGFSTFPVVKSVKEF